MMMIASSFLRPFRALERTRPVFSTFFSKSISSDSDDTEDCQGAFYRAQYRASLENPEKYWAEVAENTVWTRKWDKILDNSNPPFTKWFVGGRLSACYNALDRHVDAGHGDDVALIWDSPVTKSGQKWTYNQLLDQVSSMAGKLSSFGVGPGDVVVIYMPMVLEALVSMLAVVRLGAAHSLVFGGFAARELGRRIKHCAPKAVITASAGIERNKILPYLPIVEEALQLAEAPALLPVVVLQRPNLLVANLKSSQIDFHDALAEQKKHDCVDIEANEPLYLLYTSGTTGEPKGVQHPVGGHVVVNQWSMNAIFGMKPGETWWAASDIGWIVGHEYICYAPLYSRNPSIVYEGKPVGTPDQHQYFRVIEENKVRGMFTSPTALRALKSEDENGDAAHSHNLESLSHMFVAGEHCDWDTRFWAERVFKAPVLDNYWQTETGHPMTATCLGLGNSRNVPKEKGAFPVPGFDFRLLDEQGKEMPKGELGRLVVKLPLPPGTMSTLYKDDEAFVKTYFSKYKGYYDTCDVAILDPLQGYLSVLARNDDVINVAGHRLSTSAIEQAILEHPDITNCAVIPLSHPIKHQVPLALFVTNKDCHQKEEEVAEQLVQLVREVVGPVAAFKLALEVDALPVTRSGKTTRGLLADVANKKEVRVMPTIEDIQVFHKCKERIQTFLKCNKVHV